MGKKGVTDYVTEWLTGLLYDIDYVIANLKSPNRLRLGVKAMHFEDTPAGLTVGNTVSFTFGVTNSIKFHPSSQGSDARKAAFAYFAQTEGIDMHSGLQAGQMEDEWQGLDGRYLQMTATVPYTNNIALSQIGSGLNRAFDDLIYLTEASVQPYEGCWLAFRIEADCQLSFNKGSSHLDLGSALVYDILPNTIEQFVGLKWNKTQSLPFPTQKDFDGDGLMSQEAGGADPDDTQYDTDGDGLSDRFELTIGTDPEKTDTDSDGLSDEEEQFYGTNPLNHDADGDGLTDYIEVKLGWIAQYGTNSS
jgi:hypothetical protein